MKTKGRFLLVRDVFRSISQSHDDISQCVQRKARTAPSVSAFTQDLFTAPQVDEVQPAPSAWHWADNRRRSGWAQRRNSFSEVSSSHTGQARPVTLRAVWHFLWVRFSHSGDSNSWQMCNSWKSGDSGDPSYINQSTTTQNIEGCEVIISD